MILPLKLENMKKNRPSIPSDPPRSAEHGRDQAGCSADLMALPFFWLISWPCYGSEHAIRQRFIGFV